MKKTRWIRLSCGAKFSKPTSRAIGLRHYYPEIFLYPAVFHYRSFCSAVHDSPSSYESDTINNIMAQSGTKSGTKEMMYLLPPQQIWNSEMTEPSAFISFHCSAHRKHPGISSSISSYSFATQLRAITDPSSFGPFSSRTS